MNDRVLGGRFHLDRLLGRGGMAEVYAAYDANLDRQVAIKVLLPRFNDDEAFQERFTEEGRRAAGLNHPNIVTVLDTGRRPGDRPALHRHGDGPGPVAAGDDQGRRA